ncbi:hypothetical protein CR513_49040, partial [Mucuna pruriens]
MHRIVLNEKRLIPISVVSSSPLFIRSSNQISKPMSLVSWFGLRPTLFTTLSASIVLVVLYQSIDGVHAALYDFNELLAPIATNLVEAKGKLKITAPYSCFLCFMEYSTTYDQMLWSLMVPTMTMTSFHLLSLLTLLHLVTPLLLPPKVLIYVAFKVAHSTPRIITNTLLIVVGYYMGNLHTLAMSNWSLETVPTETKTESSKSIRPRPNASRPVEVETEGVSSRLRKLTPSLHINRRRSPNRMLTLERPTPCADSHLVGSVSASRGQSHSSNSSITTFAQARVNLGLVAGNRGRLPSGDYQDVLAHYFVIQPLRTLVIWYEFTTNSMLLLWLRMLVIHFLAYLSHLLLGLMFLILVHLIVSLVIDPFPFSFLHLALLHCRTRVQDGLLVSNVSPMAFTTFLLHHKCVLQQLTLSPYMLSLFPFCFGPSCTISSFNVSPRGSKFLVTFVDGFTYYT